MQFRKMRNRRNVHLSELSYISVKQIKITPRLSSLTASQYNGFVPSE